MSTKHTPGPWAPDGLRFVRQVNEPRHVICRLPVVTQPADQLLIAAAPELLKALANALDIITTDRNAFVECNRLRDTRTDDPIAHGLVLVTEGTWITPEDAAVVRDYDRAIAMAEAAIAKATGAA